MSIDLLRADANERVDLLDFQYLANTAFEEALRVQANWLLTDHNKAQQWILDGFAMATPSGKQLQVTLGRAILARRVSGVVHYGIVTGTGDLTKIVDMATLTPGTYNVYVRFEFVDGDNSSRIFWNPAGSGSEIVQTMATRLKANWSMRVETGSPGAEWLQIGTADNTGGSLVIVDQRPFYFEGPPSAAYASGWSTDGGGVANDRNADRQAYGVKDFQTFTAAMRQCLEDIKGRGLRRWWDRDIGGMNIGFDAAPVEDRVAIGDADMYLQWASDYPTLRMGAGGDDLTYDRAGNHWLFKIAAVEEMRLGPDGLAIANGLYVGDVTGIPVDNEIYAEGAIRSGTYLHADSGRVYLGADDYMTWDGTSWRWFLNAVDQMKLAATGLVVTTGLYVGDLAGVPTDNDIYAAEEVRAGTYLYSDGGRVYLGVDDYEVWDGTNWKFVLNAAEEARITAAGLAITHGLYVGSATGVPIDNQIYAEGLITGNLGVRGTGDASGSSGVYGVGGRPDGYSLGVEGVGGPWGGDGVKGFGTGSWGMGIAGYGSNTASGPLGIVAAYGVLGVGGNNAAGIAGVCGIGGNSGGDGVYGYAIGSGRSGVIGYASDKNGLGGYFRLQAGTIGVPGVGDAINAATPANNTGAAGAFNASAGQGPSGFFVGNAIRGTIHLSPVPLAIPNHPTGGVGGDLYVRDPGGGAAVQLCFHRGTGGWVVIV